MTFAYSDICLLTQHCHCHCKQVALHFQRPLFLVGSVLIVKTKSDYILKCTAGIPAGCPHVLDGWQAEEEVLHELEVLEGQTVANVTLMLPRQVSGRSVLQLERAHFNFA